MVGRFEEDALRFTVTGTGAYHPPRIQTAAELAPLVGRSEAWILSRAGVAERRVADEPMSRMAARAAAEALGDGPPPDLVINASLTPIQLIPDSSVFILREMGLDGIPAFSIHATCLSFLVALNTAASLLTSGAYRRILVVSSEQGSVCRNMDEPESAVLIGDGAAAVVLEPTSEGTGLLGFKMRTYPEGADLTEIRGCGTRVHPNNPEMTPADNLFHMRGPSIYRMALPRARALLEELLAELEMTLDDIDLIVPHQMSGPGLRAVERYGFPPEKIINIVGRYGNCVAASIPMALHEAVSTGRLRPGHRVMLMGTGAGLSVAAAVLQW